MRLLRLLLLPQKVGDKVIFVGLTTGKVFEHGMMVMAGRDVTNDDLFAKFVEIGTKIDSVAETLDPIDVYIEQLGMYKISNVLKLHKTKSRCPKKAE